MTKKEDNVPVKLITKPIYAVFAGEKNLKDYPVCTEVPEIGKRWFSFEANIPVTVLQV